jgi:hypothetical protein
MGHHEQSGKLQLSPFKPLKLALMLTLGSVRPFQLCGAENTLRG